MMHIFSKERVGSLVKILPGFAFDSAKFSPEEGIPLVRIRDLGNDRTETNFNGNYRDVYLVKTGDLLIGMDGDFVVDRWRGDKALLNQRVCRCETKNSQKLNQDYLFYSLIREIEAIHQMVSATTVKHLSVRQIQEIQIPLPEIEIQIAIADVLATVDRAIEQTEALIAKYRRIKAGLMHDLLTRGIDENGNLRHPSTHKFKESPLGLIPEEWEVATLERLSTKITSGSRGWAKYYSAEGALFIRIGNMTREHINLIFDDIQHVRPPVGNESKRTSLQTGDLLISITADLGIIGVVPEDIGEAYINQHIALVRLDQSVVNPWWLGNYLAGDKAQALFRSLNESGAKAGLNLPTVGSIIVPRPALGEQNAIAKLFHQADEVIVKEQKHLNKLHHLKAGLMQDLLTGRVSVEPLLRNGNLEEA